MTQPDLFNDSPERIIDVPAGTRIPEHDMQRATKVMVGGEVVKNRYGLTDPAVQRDAHDTSRQAAAAVKPVTGKIATAVLDKLRYYSNGLTDSEIKAFFPDAPESSYRKRRTELTQRGLVVDSGKTRANRNGRQEVVWVLAK